MDGWWGYLYMNGDEMVNYGGIDLTKQENQFNYTMSSDGYITPSSNVEGAPKVTNMHWDSSKDVITADVTYNGQTYHLTFTHPTDETWRQLSEYYDILLEEGIVGGYEDKDIKQKTDISGEDASEVSRARK